MDNAGGSQVPQDVLDAIRAYMESSYVQVGADYPASRVATETVERAHTFAERLMGSEGQGTAIFGPSTSALLRMLADACADSLPPGEVVVAESGHEANVSPWIHLERRGWTERLWPCDPETGVCRAEGLAPLLSPNTRIVAFPHVSNLLGGVEEIAEVVALAKTVGARTVVDGVAYAPHLPMRVAEWGVDWYAFSTYKVFGPHMAALWGRSEALAELEGPGHFFISRNDVPYKFELGGVNHESCAGLLGTERYLDWMGGMDRVAEFERPLTETLLGFLRTCPDVRVVGRSDAGTGRLPTVSFVHRSVSSRQIADEADRHGFGMRWGHFYSYRLLQAMGIEPEEGVARISLAHTNTLEEVERWIDAMSPVLR